MADDGASRIEGVVRKMCANPLRTAVLTDFDGTIAALVDDPDAATPLPGVKEVLATLASRFGLVGVVSGRPVSFLARHLGDLSLWLSGLYGLESMNDGQIEELAEAKPWRRVVSQTLNTARDAFPELIVEDKGLSMTLHFRNSPESEPQVFSWALSMASSSGLVMRQAKSSIELHPPVQTDKGTVIEDVIRASTDLGTVCFLGDDRGDLPAFSALTRLGKTGIEVIRVAVETAETPRVLLRQADLVVSGPEGALAFLTTLAS